MPFRIEMTDLDWVDQAPMFPGFEMANCVVCDDETGTNAAVSLLRKRGTVEPVAAVKSMIDIDRLARPKRGRL